MKPNQLKALMVAVALALTLQGVGCGQSKVEYRRTTTAAPQSSDGSARVGSDTDLDGVPQSQYPLNAREQARADEFIRSKAETIRTCAKRAARNYTSGNAMSRAIAMGMGGNIRIRTIFSIDGNNIPYLIRTEYLSPRGFASIEPASAFINEYERCLNFLIPAQPYVLSTNDTFIDVATRDFNVF